MPGPAEEARADDRSAVAVMERDGGTRDGTSHCSAHTSDGHAHSALWSARTGCLLMIETRLKALMVIATQIARRYLVVAENLAGGRVGGSARAGVGGVRRGHLGQRERGALASAVNSSVSRQAGSTSSRCGDSPAPRAALVWLVEAEGAAVELRHAYVDQLHAESFQPGLRGDVAYRLRRLPQCVEGLGALLVDEDPLVRGPRRGVLTSSPSGASGPPCRMTSRWLSVHDHGIVVDAEIIHVRRSR